MGFVGNLAWFSYVSITGILDEVPLVNIKFLVAWGVIPTPYPKPRPDTCTGTG